MATKAEAPEQRTIDVDVQDIDTRGKTVTGYAAVYDVEAKLDGFSERIARGAFRDVLDADVRCLLNHDPNVVLGRTKSGTLRLHDEQRGLRFELDLPKSRADLREAIARRDLDGASFRFRVGEDEWRGDQRTITRIAELKDITLATYPAYPETSIELRSRPTNNPGEAQEETMGDQPETKQDQQDQQQEEERTQRNPAGSLRVEERAEPPFIMSLADLYAQRGFFENRVASVSWDEFRSVTWTPGAGTLTDLNPVRRDAVGYGYDRRWIYPVFPQTAVSDATTSVQSLTQTARSLAGTADIIRTLDAVTTKPETSSTIDFATLQLSQVATVCSGVPRIYAAQPQFQSIVENDLRLAISDGLDALVVAGLATAGTLTAMSGTLLYDVRRAMTGLMTAGYAPDTLVIDPAGAESLDLLQSSGSERFWTWGPSRFAPGDIFGLRVRVGKSSGTAVCDSQALGRLYASPLELRSFEADGGTTNKTNYRLELSAGFGVERAAAATRIALS